MGRVPWQKFKDREPRVHLVAATVEVDQAGHGPGLREVQDVLKGLVRTQQPAGAYATTIVREAGRPELHFAFEEEGDARKLADAVRAEATGDYRGWATQRIVHLNEATVEALAASLSVPKTHRRPTPETTSTSWHRVRFGSPRAPHSRDE